MAENEGKRGHLCRHQLVWTSSYISNVDCVQLTALNYQRVQLIRKVLQLRRLHQVQGKEIRALELTMAKSAAMAEEEQQILEKYNGERFEAAVYRPSIVVFSKNLINQRAERFVELLQGKEIIAFSRDRRKLMAMLIGLAEQQYINFYAIAKSALSFYQTLLNKHVVELLGPQSRTQIPHFTTKRFFHPQAKISRPKQPSDELALLVSNKKQGQHSTTPLLQANNLKEINIKSIIKKNNICIKNFNRQKNVIKQFVVSGNTARQHKSEPKFSWLREREQPFQNKIETEATVCERKPYLSANNIQLPERTGTLIRKLTSQNRLRERSMQMLQQRNSLIRGTIMRHIARMKKSEQLAF